MADLGPYDTKLSPQEEILFQMWKQENAAGDTGSDYDLRGAYLQGLKRDPKSMHWSDQFKKPNHPTFSDESQYSNMQTPGGHWYFEHGQDVFVPFGPRPRPDPKNIDPDWLFKMNKLPPREE